MTKDGDSKKVNGLKDRVMKVDKDRVLDLIELLKYTLAGCTALREVQKKINDGDDVPECSQAMADELTSFIPKRIAIELGEWGNTLGGLKMDLPELAMLHYWIELINRERIDDDEDE
jgi:hypothetical protein